MPGGVGFISRKRLRWIPKELRLAHEYCFFLHDENTRMLVEYEEAGAHVVPVDFPNVEAMEAYREHAKSQNPIEAMRMLGFSHEARRVVLNQITLAMVSDCQNHIFEALRCLEKRKIIVALNLLRKPLTDNLLYLSWMLGDEDEFYEAFCRNSPKGITSGILKNRRSEILEKALTETEVSDVLTESFLNRMLFDRAFESGFQKLFQHAVHLITVRHVELETTQENFNFIFKDPFDDDLYEVVYYALPHALLYLSHVVFQLFTRVSAANEGGQRAFYQRSIIGLYLVEGGSNVRHAVERLHRFSNIPCPWCESKLRLSRHNAGRLVMSETLRCPSCHRITDVPFSWLV